MDKILMSIGAGAGVAGVLLCIVAVVARLAGAFFIVGMQVGTMLQAGIAAMLAGCLCLLAVLTRRSHGGG